MAALTQDVTVVRYGTPTGHPQVSQPANASITIYRGSIALADSTGYLKNASSPASTDTTWGLIDDAPLQAYTSPGIATASALGGTVIDIVTGTFFLYNSSGNDALAQSNVGQAVYVVNETTVGRTSNSNTRPVAGTLIAIDTTQPYGTCAVTLGSSPYSPPV